MTFLAKNQTIMALVLSNSLTRGYNSEATPGRVPTVIVIEIERIWGREGLFWAFSGGL